MGKFDKKVSKTEPDAPSSQKILKKKSNAELAKLATNPLEEKNRSMKILSWMQRAEEVKSVSKANAHLDIDKMVKN
jgi:hypothetical protein